MLNVEFTRAQVASLVSVCGNILWEASGSGSGSIALQSYSADALFILGTQYLYLGVLRHVFGVRYVVSVLVLKLSDMVWQSEEQMGVCQGWSGTLVGVFGWGLCGSAWTSLATVGGKLLIGKGRLDPRPNLHRTRARKFAGNSFDVACIQCGLVLSHQACCRDCVLDTKRRNL